MGNGRALQWKKEEKQGPRPGRGRPGGELFALKNKAYDGYSLRKPKPEQKSKNAGSALRRVCSAPGLLCDGFALCRVCPASGRSVQGLLCVGPALRGACSAPGLLCVGTALRRADLCRAYFAWGAALRRVCPAPACSTPACSAWGLLCVGTAAFRVSAAHFWRGLPAACGENADFCN